MRTRRKTVVVGLAGLVFLAYVVYRGANRGSDFRHQYGAARRFWETGVFHLEAQPRYPVTLHVLLSPLGALPLGVAAGVWAVASFAAVAALPGVLARLSGVAPRDQLPAWALTTPFFVDALILGQSDPLNILLVASGLAAARGGRGAAGAGLIGLAGMIKLLPVVHWGSLLARRRTLDVWAGMALTAAAGFGLVVAALGWGPAVSALRAQANWLRGMEQPWHLVARGADLRPNNESLPITLARTLGALPSGFRDPHVVSIARLPLDQIWLVWRGVLAALIVAWVASLRPASRVAPGRGWLAVFALTSTVMLAATPVAWHHYFLWTLPSALFLVRRRRLLLATAVVSLVVTATPAARGLGGHMVLALGLGALVVHDLRREADAIAAAGGAVS